MLLTSDWVAVLFINTVATTQTDTVQHTQYTSQCCTPIYTKDHGVSLRASDSPVLTATRLINGSL